jgi:hypothetical protein
MLNNLKHLKIFEEHEPSAHTASPEGRDFSSLSNIKDVAIKAASLDNVEDAISMLQNYIDKNESEIKNSMYILNRFSAPIMFYSMMYPVIDKWGFDILNKNSIEFDSEEDNGFEDLESLDF